MLEFQGMNQRPVPGALPFFVAVLSPLARDRRAAWTRAACPRIVAIRQPWSNYSFVAITRIYTGRESQ